MNEAVITEKMLDDVRTGLCELYEGGLMSEKRYRHTLEVEKMAARLGEILAPEKISVLRAAGLLHDITKEYPVDMHILICAEHGLELTPLDLCAPKTLHARTAALRIPTDYPELAFREVIDCVRWHTTGHAGMSLCEKIVYLADYIDMSRKFEDCVRLRDYFFCEGLEEMTQSEKLAHLDDTLLISYDITIAGLIEKGAPISYDTISARNELAVKKCLKNKE